MRVLVAGEFTQIITQEFLQLGHDAWSCDTEPTEGDPSRHFRCRWQEVVPEPWDLLIAHPVCTRLTNCGNKWYVGKDARPEYWDDREQAIKDFNYFQGKDVAHIKKRAIENPHPSGYVIKRIGRFTQKVQPWWFGDMETKGICWWLTGLRKLYETNNVYEEMMKLPYKDRARVHWMAQGPEREKERSRFFPGAAKAIAWQWGAEK